MRRGLARYGLCLAKIVRNFFGMALECRIDIVCDMVVDFTLRACALQNTMGYSPWSRPKQGTMV